MSASSGLTVGASPSAAGEEGTTASAVVVEAVTSIAVAVFDLTQGIGLEAGGVDDVVRGWFLGLLNDPSDRLVRPEPRRISSSTATAVLATPVWALPVLRSSRGLPAAASRPAAGGGHAPRAVVRPPPPRPSLPENVPVAALALGGFASGSSGDRNFLFLLLIPFAFALADAARRVTREASAVAAQVESSRRERPG